LIGNGIVMHDSLEILFHENDVIAVNKPHGLLVHRTSMAKDAKTSVLQILRAQLASPIHTIHRLDRKTSGILLVALSKEQQSYLSEQFRERKVRKVYHAIVRGFTEDVGSIDYAIKNDRDQLKDAVTHYKTLERFEIEVPLGKHQTSRYSLVELYPQTGRYHQLRMHMAHIFHPIIGDRPHGCNKQNRMFKTRFKMEKMMLHATSIEFSLPKLGPIYIEADKSGEFKRVLEIISRKENLPL